MVKLNSKHGINKTKRSIVGRLVHDVPESLSSKPKPSDKPTIKLSEENIETPIIHDNPIPGTTVLGMDLDDNELFDKPKAEDNPKTNNDNKKQEKPKTKEKPNPKSDGKKETNTPSKVLFPSEKLKKETTPKYAKLVLVRKLDGEIVKISKKDFIIGKSKYSDYQVTKNNTVSRSHIVAHKHKDGSLTIEDNNSKNGTFIDGERLKANEEIKLKDGMSLRLSDEIFDVKKA